MPRSELARKIRDFVRGFGFDYAPFPRLGTMEFHFGKIAADVLVDAGANNGQYGALARRWGYTGNIISFEPVNSAFEGLKRASAGDAKWAIHNLALGDADTTGVIHVSADTTLSSLLGSSDLMTRFHTVPGAVVGDQSITIRRLDGMTGQLQLAGKSIWLKTDTQGSDLNVLRGAEGVLPQINTIQMELSTRRLYQDQTLIDTVIGYLRERNFYVADIILGGRDDDGLIEADAIFKRQA